MQQRAPPISGSGATYGLGCEIAIAVSCPDCDCDCVEIAFALRFYRGDPTIGAGSEIGTTLCDARTRERCRTLARMSSARLETSTWIWRVHVQQGNQIDCESVTDAFSCEIFSSSLCQSPFDRLWAAQRVAADCPIRCQTL